MSKFTDHLWRDLVQEHGPTLAHADRPEAGRARRPRILAGSTLGLAGVGAVLVLALGGSAAPPAFAITKQNDGSVLVKLNYLKDLNLPQVNDRLTALGTHEQITIYMASGAAAVSGPVTCTPGPGAGSPTTPVKVLVGANGTEVIGSGQSAGNTAEGTFHLARCTVAPDSDTGPGTGNTGNTGAS
ncbi:MAG TPA: hypothetical protein VIY10_09865 [Solirubrobacteraceae bacterium]|jgi:hypothetical protein